MKIEIEGKKPQKNPRFVEYVEDMSFFYLLPPIYLKYEETQVGVVLVCNSSIVNP
jgi:hypothetical protein